MTNIFDGMVYDIWFEVPKKYEKRPCSTRNRILAGIHTISIILSVIAVFAIYIAQTMHMWQIPLYCVLLMLALIPRCFITEPDMIPIDKEWLRNQTEVHIQVKDLESGNITDMLYNAVYNQAVAYTEEGMKVVSLPLYDYNKTWVAYDNDDQA